MQAIQPSLFIQPSLQLRIWFSDGVNAFAALTPLQNLTPAPYAIMANSASNLLGALPLSQLSAGTANINISGNAATATTANNFSGSLSGDVTGTQGATVVVTVGGQTAANVAGGASAANAATSANTANTIVKRDASGNFSADTITLDANLNLPATTATAGIIYFGGSPLIHAYGTQNFFAGSGAGNLTMSGSGGNTGVGYQALQNNTNGYYNTACGDDALYANTTGFDNTAFGRNALYANTVGYFNTACGNNALKTNSTGYANVACGVDALYANTTGWANTAIGTAVLYINTTGSCNTGIGNSAISYNTTGNSNTAVGFSALLNCSNGICNIALGSQAGQNITTGSYNIDIGNQGVSTDNNIIRIGDVQTATYLAGTVYATGNPGFSGSCSTYCGNGVYGIINSTCGAGVMGQANSGAAHGVIAAYGSDGNHICYLGNANSAADLHGNVYVTGNVGIGTGSPDALLSVNGTADKPGGGSWSTFSDGRLKDVGADFTHGLAALENIQPVHYHYKADNPLNLPSQPEYVGVVAQQVQNAVPEAVQRNHDGYLVVNNDPIIWTMVNAIKELNQKRETEAKEKDAEIQELKQNVAELKAMVEKLAAK